LSRFDSILLGDNSFYGVDHLSHERARKRAAKIQNVENIVEVIKCSLEMGINGMVVANRPRLREWVKRLRNNSELFDRIDFYPVIPYAQGLQLKLSEGGIVKTMKDIMKAGGLKNEIKILARGGLNFIKKDTLELFKVFIDTELLKLKDLSVKIIYLHPALTDLALALNMKNIFETFQNHLRDKYKIDAGLCTKNFPFLVGKLEEWDLKFSSIMTSFNKAGYLMNPSKQECETCLERYNGDVLAMNIFAGGYLGLDEATEYIFSQPKIRNIVVGVSSVEHAKQTFARLTKNN